MIVVGREIWQRCNSHHGDADDRSKLLSVDAVLTGTKATLIEGCVEANRRFAPLP